MQIAYVKIDVTAGMLRICDSTSSITCLPRFLPNTAQRSRTSVSLVSGPWSFPNTKTVAQGGAGAGAVTEKEDKRASKIPRLSKTHPLPRTASTSCDCTHALALRTLHIIHFPQMSSPDKSSPPRDGANGQDEKPRLTEEQKRQNHISSGTFSSHRFQAHPYAIHCMWHTRIPAHEHISILARPMYAWGYTVYTRPYVSRGRSGLSLFTPTADG